MLELDQLVDALKVASAAAPLVLTLLGHHRGRRPGRAVRTAGPLSGTGTGNGAGPRTPILVEQVCHSGPVTWDWGMPTPARIRETATYVITTADGELPQCLLLLGDLPDGRGYIYAMELPWGGHETERTYDTVPEACAAADEVYRLWKDTGAWQIQRRGWQRPTPEKPA